MYALVDANNMYVSCERVFQPRLAGRPVVVLSSNDGACIARSDEAKALGVTMAQPWFQVRPLERQGLIALSANFELYQDMSHRMMALVGRYSPWQEVYSIDESFLRFDDGATDTLATGRALRDTVLREIGLPTCVGFGPTKTLAKLANHIAKSADRKPGSYPATHAQVCDLGRLDPAAREALFAATPVTEVWGIGRRIGAALEAGGVHTVRDLVRADAGAIRQRFNVVVEKTLLELRGTPCLGFDDPDEPPAPRQQILVSRSFGSAITQVEGIVEAVSEFASRAAEKLRAQGSVAGELQVFFSTSPHCPGDRPHHPVVRVPLGRPSADTRRLVSAAAQAARAQFRSGHRYVKAGVMLGQLQTPHEAERQGELDLGSPAGALPAVPTPAVPMPVHARPAGGVTTVARTADRAALMQALDALNRRFGRDAVQLASARAASSGAPVRAWATRQERRSPRYTTRWDEMPQVRA